MAIWKSGLSIPMINEINVFWPLQFKYETCDLLGMVSRQKQDPAAAHTLFASARTPKLDVILRLSRRGTSIIK